MVKLKRFFIGYFSNNYLKESCSDGLIGTMLSLLLTLIIIFCGILGGELLPFGVRYAQAADYKETLGALFSDITLNISEGRAEVSGGNGGQTIIDTFSDNSDKQKYGRFGYEVVVDTRPTEFTFDDFESKFVTSDGKSEISLDEYRKLSEGLKQNYKFKVEYTGKTIELSQENTVSWENYITTSADSDIKNKLNDIKTQNLSETEYRASVYELYVKAVYPDTSEYESDCGAPKIRNYYQQEYLRAKSRKYIFILCDSVISGFETENGAKESVYGIFSQMRQISVKSAEDVDNFINASVASSRTLVVYNFAMNYLNMSMFYIILWFVAALICLFMGKWLNLPHAVTYGSNMRLSGAIWLWTSVFTAILTIAFGFITPKGKVAYVALLIFFCLLLVRLALYFIPEKIKLRRSEAEEEIVAE